MLSQTDGEGNTTTYTYDNMGNCTSVTDAKGNKRTMEYDGQGRLISQTDAQAILRPMNILKLASWSRPPTRRGMSKPMWWTETGSIPARATGWAIR